MSSPAPRAALRPEDLAELGHWLRAHDLRVDARQVIAAARLLTGARRSVPVAELGPWLAPIFCSNATDQHRFGELYERWLSQRSLGQSSARQERAAPIPAKDKRPTGPFALPVGALLLLLMLVMVVGVAWQAREHTTVVRVLGPDKGVQGAQIQVGTDGRLVVTDADGDAKVRYRHWELPLQIIATHASYSNGNELQGITAKIDVARDTLEIRIPHIAHARVPDAAPRPAFGRRIDALAAPAILRSPDAAGIAALRVDPPALAVCLALLCVPIAWWTFTMLRRRGFLERVPAQDDETVRRIAAAAPPALSDIVGDLRYLGRELRRRRTVPSRALDVAATLVATLRSGGRPHLVFGARAEPDYLILVERVGVSDHQSQLADQVLRTLLAQGISLDRYEFHEDPRRCHHAPLEGAALHIGPQTLAQLYSRHPDARLLVFSDGSAFSDRYSGRPSTWVSSLFCWSSPVLMTPQPRAQWGLREWLLGKTGLTILPLDGEGLHMLGDVFRQQKSSPQVPARAQQRSRPAYVRDADLLLDRNRPEAEVLHAVFSDLERDLGMEGIVWLAACAVYPEVHWAITLTVGDSLMSDCNVAAAPSLDIATAEERPRRFAGRLAPLCRLPWMRWGYMPDWLRKELLDRLPPQAEEAVRTRLNTFLSSVTKPAKTTADGKALHISLEPPRSLWGDVLVGLRSMKSRSPGRKDVVEDRIFLRFMSGPRRRLAVTASDALMRLFYRQGAPLAGPRAWPLTLAIVATAWAAAVRPPLQWIAPATPATFIAPKPALLALDRDGRHLVAANDRGTITIKTLVGGPRQASGPVPDCAMPEQGELEMLAVEGAALKMVAHRAGQTRVILAGAQPSGAMSCDATLIARDSTTRVAVGYRNGVLETSALPATGVESAEALCTAVDGAVVTRIGQAFVAQHLLPPEETPAACAVSGDGKRLVVATRSGVAREFLLDVRETALVDRRAQLPLGATVSQLALSRDGAILSATRDDGSVWVLHEGAAVWTPLGRLDATGALAISGDGQTLAFATSRREVEVWRLGTPQTVNRFLVVDVSENAGARPSTWNFSQNRLSPEMGAIANTLRFRYRFQNYDALEPSQSKGTDRLVVFMMGAEGFATLSDEDEADSLLFARTAETLAVLEEPEALVIARVRSGASTKLALRPQPSISVLEVPRSRWLLLLDDEGLKLLDDELRTSPQAMTATAVFRLVEGKLRLAGRTTTGVQYVQWYGAGHQAGDIVLAPTGDPLPARGRVIPRSPSGRSASLQPTVRNPDALIAPVSVPLAALAPGKLALSKFADPVYYLTQSLRWRQSSRDGRSGQAVDIPIGFVTKLDSVPRVAALLLTPSDSYVMAVLLLEYLYWDQTRTREESNEIFRMAMEDLGVSRSTNAALYSAVKFYGQAAWDQNAQLKAQGERRILQVLPEDPDITWEEWKRLPGVLK